MNFRYRNARLCYAMLFLAILQEVTPCIWSRPVYKCGRCFYAVRSVSVNRSSLLYNKPGWMVSARSACKRILAWPLTTMFVFVITRYFCSDPSVSVVFTLSVYIQACYNGFSRCSAQTQLDVCQGYRYGQQFHLIPPPYRVF